MIPLHALDNSVMPVGHGWGCADGGYSYAESVYNIIRNHMKRDIID